MRRLRSGSFRGRGRLESTRKDLVSKNGEIVPVTLTASIIYEGTRKCHRRCFHRPARAPEDGGEAQPRATAVAVDRAPGGVVELAGAAAHELNQP